LDPDAYLCQLADIFNSITVHTPSVSAIIAIVLAGVLLLASGFASASEIAFFSLSPSDLNSIEEGKHPSDEKIRNLLDDTERLLATILITNNFVNVTIIMLCNFFFMNVFQFHSVIAEFLILTVILTFLLLLFGEIMPKIYSAQKTLAFCRFAAPGIMACRSIFYPLSSILVRSTSFLNKHFVRKNHNISVDELSHALELTDKAELSEENNILEGIIRFGGETAKEGCPSEFIHHNSDMNLVCLKITQQIINHLGFRNKIRVHISGVSGKQVKVWKNCLLYFLIKKNMKRVLENLQPFLVSWSGWLYVYCYIQCLAKRKKYTIIPTADPIWQTALFPSVFHIPKVM